MSEIAIPENGVVSEPTAERAHRFSLSEDWLAVIPGLALVAFVYLSVVRIPW